MEVLMKKINKFVILLLACTIFLVSCGKKEDIKVTELVEETTVIDETDKEEEKEDIRETEKIEETSIELKEELPRSLLSGLETTEELSESPIIGIMLDNHPNARWQAGLREAELIYEIRVEGNTTRYLALFQVNNPSTIGPIRSARTPFINRILEYDAVYLHYGAASCVMNDIYNLGLNNINGIFVGQPVYYRNHNVGKVAPHNAYASMDGIREFMKNNGYPDKTEFVGYNFHDQASKPGGEKVEEFTLHIMPYNQTSYRYQAEEGIYHRYKDGILQLDENDQEPLEVTNVIVQFANGVLNPNGIHTDILDVGEGNGLFFSQGQVIDINWEKADRRAFTEYYDLEGEPLKLNIGQTFIQVVDDYITIDMDQ